MKVNALDLRRRMKDVLKALEQNETVTLYYRGKLKAVMYPAGDGPRKYDSVRKHPAVGLWKERKDLQDVDGYIRKIRKGRQGAV